MGGLGKREAEPFYAYGPYRALGGAGLHPTGASFSNRSPQGLVKREADALGLGAGGFIHQARPYAAFGIHHNGVGAFAHPVGKREAVEEPVNALATHPNGGTSFVGETVWGFPLAKAVEKREANSKESIHEELSSLLDACDNWLKSASDADLEAVMNKFISKLTEMGASSSNALLRIKVLNNLFVGLPISNPLRYDVYIGQLRLASKFGQTNDIMTSLTQVKTWLKTWNVDMEQRRVCYRELHAALKDQQRGEEATKVMLELLSTYGETSAVLAKEDAEKCVIDFISKPDVFIMDHLLKLKPVMTLQGQPIYRLLEIFVSGVLADYLDFYEVHKEWVSETGLDHDANIHKMRILTTLSLSVQEKEISFRDLRGILGFTEEDDIEEYIIDLIKSKLLHAKMDEMNEKMIIRSSSVRTFGRDEWQQLEYKLESWFSNMQSIRSSLEQVVQAGVGG